MSLVRFLDKMLIMLACLALFVMMVMTFFDVILRSVWNAPIEASTELTRIFMVIIVFSVMPRLSLSREHIVVDLTDGIFSRLGVERLRDGLVQILCGLALMWPASRIWKLAMRSKSYGDVTEYLSIPQFWVGSFVAISVALTAILLIIHGVRFFLPQKQKITND